LKSDLLEKKKEMERRMRAKVRFNKRAMINKLLRGSNAILPDEYDRDKLSTFLADPWINRLILQKRKEPIITAKLQE